MLISSYKRAVRRWSSIVISALIAVGFVVIVWKGTPRPTPAPTLPPWSWALAAHDARVRVTAPAPSDAEQDADPLSLSAVPPPSALTPAHRLPPGAPKSVRFGVVLIRYRGAESAPEGERDKLSAFALARSLRELAKRNFAAAVANGDPGSTEDAGRLPRGLLEPSVEFDLFRLGPGSVSDPIDTPRGYWVARRIELIGARGRYVYGKMAERTDRR